MRKKTLHRIFALLSTSLISCGANAGTVTINPGNTHTLSSLGTINDDFDFINNPPPGNGTLRIDSGGGVVFTGQLLNDENGILTLAGNGTILTISNNQTLIDINQINIDMNDGAMIINQPSSNTTTITSNWSGISCCSPITFLTPVIVTKASFADAVSSSLWGYVGKPTSSASLTYKTENGVDLSFIRLGHVNSEIILDSTNFTTSLNFANGANIGGFVSTSSDVSGNPSDIPTDEAGIFRMIANNNPLTYESGNSLGIDPVTRLKLIDFAGNDTATLDAELYVKNINFNSSGKVDFLQDVSLGTNGGITLQKNTSISLRGSGGGMTSIDPTFNLVENKFDIRQGNASFTGDVTISTKANAAAKDIGRIIVGSEAPSTLDLSLADTLTVSMEGSSSVLPGGEEYDKLLFSEGAFGTFNNITNINNITFIDNEANPLITWAYDKDTTKMTSITTPAKLVAIVTSSPNTSSSSVIVAQEIVAGVERGNERALDLLNALTSTDPGEIISNMPVSERLQALIPTETIKNVTEEAESVGTAIVVNRINSFAAIKENINFTEEFGIGVAAGDDIITKYGIWAAPFYQIATQKQFDADPGYKVWNYGATIGADTMVADNITLGLAFAHVRSRMKQFGVKLGSKTRTYTNMVSLYGLIDLDKDYYISGIGSYGISRINSRDIRQVGNATPRTAHAKYKAHIFSSQIVAGKRFRINNTRLIPTIGVRYANFIDDAYAETGADALNLSLSRKTSCNIEGLVGLRAIKEYNVGEYKLEPEIFGGANINLRNKKPVTYISNPAFDHVVKLEGESPSKAWYYLGGSLNSTKDNLEVSLSYEAQIDKEYIGHQGVCRLRLNF